MAADWLWGELRWGRVQYSEVAEAERENLAFAPKKWVKWLQGFGQVAVQGKSKEVKKWGARAAQRMAEKIKEKRQAEETMADWDPKSKKVMKEREEQWLGRDPKYAHLFKVSMPSCRDVVGLNWKSP